MKKAIYLDNNATTPIDPRVLAAMQEVLTNHFGNPASNTHAYGWYAEELVSIAREKTAACINASPEEIIFTSGATESINLALKGLALRNLKDKAAPLHLFYPATEHKATLDSAAALNNWATQSQAIPVDDKGYLVEGNLFLRLKNSPSAIVSICLANNEIGTIQNAALLINAVKEISAKTLVHIDASQAIGKIPVDFKGLNADLLSFSGHKIYGPKGIGALFIKKELHSKIEPLIHGGGHEQGLRSGTLNVPAIVGFGKACEVATKELIQDRAKLTKLSNLFYSELEKKVEISLNGPPIERRLPGNLNICAKGASNTDLVGKLNSKVAFSISSACNSRSKTPSHVLAAIGLSEKDQRSSFRIGIGRFTTEEEITQAVQYFASHTGINNNFLSRAK